MSGIAGTILGLLQSVSHIGEMLSASVDARVRQLRDGVRAEVRRITASIALSILAGACGFAALAFGAAAILIAAWNTHPALAASLIAVGFALVAVLAVLLIRGNTR